MITIAEMQLYQTIMKKIENIDADISTIRTAVPTTGRPSIGGHSSVPGDPTARKTRQIMKLEAERKDLIREAKRIRHGVELIDDVKVRRVCMVHYIAGKTWRDTAAIVCNSNSGTTACSIVKRFFHA